MVFTIDLGCCTVRFGFTIFIHTEVHFIPWTTCITVTAIVFSECLMSVRASVDGVVPVVGVVYATVSLCVYLLLAAAPAEDSSAHPSKLVSK